MKCLVRRVFVLLTLVSVRATFNNSKWPTVGLSILVRNKAHSLPYFFTCVDQLDYPKERMYIWISSDHNEDESDEVVDYWVNLNKHKYNAVYLHRNNSAGPLYPDETSPSKWSTMRFRHVINLREKAVVVAKQKWADFLLMIDVDVYLTNPNILKSLVILDFPVVAPMLHSEGLYSNFWSAMNERKYYKRSAQYLKIRERENLGCFDVPMVHSAVLINMNHPKTDYLTYDDRNLSGYDGPVDDIIIFAVSAAVSDIKLKICNAEHAGYVQVPLAAGENIKKDIDQLLNVKLLALSEGHELPLSNDVSMFVKYPEPTKLGMDEIYMINLERRGARREYMNKCFKELGLSVKLFKAVDGLQLNLEDLPYHIKLMPGYEDPYHKRPMKTGEIGCFLSHYQIWLEMVKNGYKKVIVLEDDVFFRPYFRLNLRRLLIDLKTLNWDLVYLGRKILQEQEPEETFYTVKPYYTYWTLGYILSLEGARKLLAARPLENLLPVDEFLPIMFDQHPNDTWKSFFPNRNLVALSSNPLLIEPMRYVNQPGYISDTESSFVVDYETGRMYPAHPSNAGYEYLEADEFAKPEVPEMAYLDKIEL